MLPRQSAQYVDGSGEMAGTDQKFSVLEPKPFGETTESFGYEGIDNRGQLYCGPCWVTATEFVAPVELRFEAEGFYWPSDKGVGENIRRRTLGDWPLNVMIAKRSRPFASKQPSDEVRACL